MLKAFFAVCVIQASAFGRGGGDSRRRGLLQGLSSPDVRYLLFSSEEKRSKKVVGTLATVSQAPQRFKASELINACFLTVGTDVLGCPNRTAAGAVPGRNYKLLPALAIDSPPGCQCGYAAASRPLTL